MLIVIIKQRCRIIYLADVDNQLTYVTTDDNGDCISRGRQLQLNKQPVSGGVSLSVVRAAAGAAQPGAIKQLQDYNMYFWT